MTKELLELITSALPNPSVVQVIQSTLNNFILTLSEYLLIPFDKEGENEGNPFYYLEEENDFSEEASVDLTALKMIKIIVDKFGDIALEQIIKLINSKLSFSEDKLLKKGILKGMEFISQNLLGKTVDHYRKIDHKQYKQIECGYRIMGKFSDEILAYQRKNSTTLNLVLLFNSFNLYQHIFLSKSHVLGRALWCINEITELAKSHEKECLTLANLSAESMSSKYDISIRIIASKALLNLMQKVELVRNNLNINIFKTNLLSMIFSNFNEIKRITYHFLKYLSKLDMKKIEVIFDTLYSEFFRELINPLCEDWLFQEICDILINLASNIKTNLYLVKPFCDFLNSLFKSSNDPLILKAMLEILNSLILHTTNDNNASSPINNIISQVISLSKNSLEVNILQSSTLCIRSYVAYYYQYIYKNNFTGLILDAAKSLLSITIPEMGCQNVGYILVHVFERLTYKVSTEILILIVHKIFKSRMPSVVQSLVLVFARLIHKNAQSILKLLSETSIENRICLKIFLDKWLLHQQLFRGKYTRSVTYSALMHIFFLKDKNIESQMVITYNPSHSNVNNEVNAPFKILCTLLRCIDIEKRSKNVTMRDEYEEETNDLNGNNLSEKNSNNENELKVDLLRLI